MDKKYSENALLEVVNTAQELVDYFKYHNKNLNKAQDAKVDDLEEALQKLKQARS